MINNLKIVFCVVLCVLVCGAAIQTSAQAGADKVLVGGKHPLRQSQIDKVIEFYEWAFETEFSADERDSFLAISIESFRQDAATSYQNADTIVQALAKIQTKDEAAQRKVRAVFNDGFVQDLRVGVEKGDEASVLLFGIYQRGQNSSRVVFDESYKTPKSAKFLGGSNKLVGRWMRSTGAGRGDDGAGKTTYSSGENTTFEFFADGTMQFTVDKKVSSITQCRVSEVTKIPGTYTFDGSQLTMNLSAGTSIGSSSCEKAGNFRKNLSASTLTKNVIVRKMESVFRPDQPLLLCLDGATGDNDCFERDPKS